MKIVFMGTPEFAVEALEYLIEDDLTEVLLVVSKEDKPKGRGNKIAYTPTKELALKHGIEVFTPKRVKDKDSVEYIKSFNPDVIVVVAYGQILSKEILDIPKYGCINIHGSVLPKYRGPAPIHRTIINGDEEAGVTIMYMDEGLDTGDIIKTKSVKVQKDDTTGTMYDKLKTIGAKALLETLYDINNGVIERTKQDDALSSYAPLIEKDKCVIGFDKSASEIECFVRGLIPFPKAYTYLNEILYKITSVEILDDYKKDFKNKKNGEILEVTKESIIVKTSDKPISIKKIQKEGSKEMLVSEFLKGNDINVSDVFTQNR